ncbi:MAG TPA: VTC domain-containing protein [Bacteroidales bacterium]|nr:VTC domain-containing protein [Bacteroidales bacterium]
MIIQEHIKKCLSAFEPIDLKEMDSVELMNRTDTKYVFNLQLLPEILDEAKSRYRVLEINNDRFFTYKTTYYDTSDYELFNNHVLGRLNRHKIRHRTYESTGVSYLEVKFKSNKDRTIKWRIKK